MEDHTYMRIDVFCVFIRKIGLFKTIMEDHTVYWGLCKYWDAFSVSNKEGEK